MSGEGPGMWLDGSTLGVLKNEVPWSVRRGRLSSFMTANRKANEEITA